MMHKTLSAIKANLTSENVKEFLELLWINLKVQWHNLVEFGKVIFCYYPRFSFMKVDLTLLVRYLFTNPFRVSKRFLLKKGVSPDDVYTYGETPLTTLDKISKECGINGSDTVFELGCGRGRTCFWLNSFVGCRVVGVECVPEFVQEADRVVRQYHVDGVGFRQEDMMVSDLSGASVVYLYGTCLEPKEIKALIKRFEKLPAGTKFITVSYSLTEYTDKPLFEVMKLFPVKMTWGEADIYLQVRK